MQSAGRVGMSLSGVLVCLSELSRAKDDDEASLTALLQTGDCKHYSPPKFLQRSPCWT